MTRQPFQPSVVVERRQAAPAFLAPHTFEVSASRDAVWRALERAAACEGDPATSVEGQCWPFRLEFMSCPTRGEFWVEDAEDFCSRERLRVSGPVRPPLARLWTRGQQLLCTRFPRWMARSLHSDVGA